MMKFFATIVAICSVNKAGVDAIICKNYDLSVTQPVVKSMDCADPQNGDNREKCLLRVVINTTSSQSSFWKSCMKKDTPETVCGQTAPSTTTPGISIKNCCCDTDNCNNDAFGQQCNQTSPTITTATTTTTTTTPAPKECYIKKIKDNTILKNLTKEICQDHRSQCAVVVIKERGNITELEHKCISAADAVLRCGTKITTRERILKTCCCHDAMLCNDDDWGKDCRCQLIRSGVMTNSACIAVILLSFLLSSVFT